MAEVIYLNNIEEYDEPHIQGEAMCTNCNNVWTGVYPVGTKNLECPDCKTLKGVFKHHLAPMTPNVWQCNCGNRLFFLLKDKIQCVNCGTIVDNKDVYES